MRRSSSYDNNSTDGTGEIARGLGVRVVTVPRQGKGHAVRAAFADLGDWDVIVLTDGDGTYPAECGPAPDRAAARGSGRHGRRRRQPAPGAGAMTLIRGLGNMLIRAAFWLLIGPGTTDLLSGYRTFNLRFRKTVQLRSAGLRDRDGVGQRGGREEAQGCGDSRPLSSTDRWHAEQATSVLRRLRILRHDH